MIHVVCAILYGLVTCWISAFFEEDTNTAETLFLTCVVWPLMLAFAALVVGPFALSGYLFGKWRDGVLQRRREARWAIQHKPPPPALPTTPEPSQLGYRDGVCTHCGQPVQQREEGHERIV